MEWHEMSARDLALEKSRRYQERMKRYRKKREKNMIEFDMTAKTREELIEKLEQYQKDYPKGGYGTTVWVPLKDGDLWRAKVTRSESCD